jgi:hypothetical protein
MPGKGRLDANPPSDEPEVTEPVYAELSRRAKNLMHVMGATLTTGDAMRMVLDADADLRGRFNAWLMSQARFGVD